MSHNEMIVAPLEEKRKAPFEWRRDAVIAAIIILVAVIAFGLGRLSAMSERAPIRIDPPADGDAKGAR